MNRFEDSDILTKTAELLDLPMDVVAGLPNLELLGDRQLFLSHHQGILSYSDTAIDVNWSGRCPSARRTAGACAGAGTAAVVHDRRRNAHWWDY